MHALLDHERMTYLHHNIHQTWCIAGFGAFVQKRCIPLVDSFVVFLLDRRKTDLQNGFFLWWERLLYVFLYATQQIRLKNIVQLIYLRRIAELAKLLQKALSVRERYRIIEVEQRPEFLWNQNRVNNAREEGLARPCIPVSSYSLQRHLHQCCWPEAFQSKGHNNHVELTPSQQRVERSDS